MYSRNWMYHPTLAPKGRLVSSEQEEAALVEDGWCDTPGKFRRNAVVVPTVEEVLAAGYSPEAAGRIITRQQALKDGATPEEAEVIVAAAEPPDPQAAPAVTTEADAPLPVGTVIPTLPGRRNKQR